jgi:predicted Zn-dependent peptidase
LYQKITLDNGLRVITADMPHTCSVCVSLFVGAGSRYEAEAQAGVSHFIEHLLFKGTEKRPSARDLAEAIEGVGGILNGGTDKELTVYWCKVAQPHFRLALDVLADMLLHSRFEPVEIEKERQVIIEEINMSRDFPSQRVNMLIDELLWPDHPLGRDVAGSRGTVTAISREAMFDYIRAQYLPAGSVVCVAGNVRHDEVMDAVGQALGGWAGRGVRPAYLPYEGGSAPRLKVEVKETEQAHLCLALPGLSFFHPRRFVLDLLNIVLGEGMSSRLFTEIRDRLGLAYSIQSYVDHFLDSGSLIVYAGTEPKNLEAAIKAILEQLAQLREGVPEAELSKAKELSKGRLLLRMEDSRNVAGWAGGQEVLRGSFLTVEEVTAIIDAITAEEVRQIARELITDGPLRLAVVGPVAAEPLEELLRL